MWVYHHRQCTALVPGCEGPSIAELRGMLVVWRVKPNNHILFAASLFSKLITVGCAKA